MAAAEAREPPPALPFSAVKETVTEMGQQEVEKLLGKAVYRCVSAERVALGGFRCASHARTPLGAAEHRCRATQVPRWTATISERLMKRLVALRAQKKYIIVVNIL